MAAQGQRRRGAAIVLWSLGFLLAGHVAATAFFGYVRPELIDVEYQTRVESLRACVRAEPDRPLVVVLGSSRVLNGLAADHLPPPTKGGRGPLVFNMGMTGAGPVAELVCLRRLIQDGMCPRAIVVEVMPRSLCAIPNGEDQILESIPAYRRGWRDADIVPPDKRWPRVRELVSTSLFSNRWRIISRWAPRWMPKDKQAELFQTTSHGWMPYPMERVSPEVHAVGLESARKEYAPVLCFDSIGPYADRIYRAFFEVCREHGIEVLGLVTMPESKVFRSWYKPETRALIERYLTALCREYGTRYINATEWLADDQFFDGHHPLMPGARAFSARLWSEVLEPWAATR